MTGSGYFHERKQGLRNFLFMGNIIWLMYLGAELRRTKNNRRENTWTLPARTQQNLVGGTGHSYMPVITAVAVGLCDNDRFARLR